MSNDIFLSNRSEIKFIDKVKESIRNCKSFYMSVSFIKLVGLKLIQREIEEALERGVKIKFITSTYQCFTDIPSLELFNSWQNKYENFECHLDHNCFGDNGFHSKGYLFEYDDNYEFIVGSSNLTRFALLKNIEWNVSISNKEKTNSMIKAYEEFDALWERTYKLNEKIIKEYQTLLEYSIEKWDMDYVDPSRYVVKPNAMQRKALKEIKRYRDMGASKSLVVSATGSGKTYLAAFDARNFSPQRFLFIVHRETILKDAIKTFSNVFGTDKSYGLYTGNIQELDRDFIFATSSMLSKHLDDFKKDEFDYICFDEVHHMAADGGMKIFKYFEPEFLLGLTATPDRMDKKDIYELFDKNVPFDLRLKDAISYDLVVPFHYYGIKTDYADYSSDDKMVIAKEISSPENVEFISSKIEEYKLKNEKLKALAFCTNIDHCYSMATELRNHGYNALALTGQNDTGERIKAFNDLQNEDNELEIICTVDILNEGVDIPAVNMVLFLRPTDSEVIFIQQLGRGLRKYPNKEYVTVLDFIGNNYDRAVQIVKALGELGDTTYMEKSYLRDLIKDNFKRISLPGVEINFDEKALEEVLRALDKSDFNTINYLKKDYENFKKYLNQDNYPTHMDFLNADVAPDLIRFLKSKIKGTMSHSYYSFLKKIGEEGLPQFTDDETTLIDSIEDMLPISRKEEMLILKDVLENEQGLDEDTIIKENITVSNESMDYAITYLKDKNILDDNNQFKINVSDEMKEYLNNMLEYALVKHDAEYNSLNEDISNFYLYKNYSKEQIAMHLGERVQGPMGKRMFSFKQLGTWFVQNDDDSYDTYVFVGLKKDTIKQKRSNYKNKFIDSKVFQWESKKDVTFESNEGKKILNSKNVHLFIRKMDEEDKITLPFTYFGTGHFTNHRSSKVVDEIKGLIHNTLLMDVILDNEVPEFMYLDFEIERKHEN